MRTGWIVAGLLGAGLAVPAGAAHAAPPECGAQDVTASYRATDAGMGHRYGVIRVTNATDRTCTVRGFGGLSYVGRGDGTQIGAAAGRTGRRGGAVVLEPGASARSVVDAVSAQNYPRRECRPTRVDGFRVYLPDETRSLFVPHRTIGCANGDVGLLHHRAYRRGSA